MQIARELAGYSFGEADLLRRAMGKKIRAEMDKQRVRFMEGAQEKGISEADAHMTFEACAKFADYGFNKSHSAPYALLTYQTAWLKANHPVEFLTASMSLDMPATPTSSPCSSRKRKRMKVEVRPPDINKSGADFTVEDGAVRYALGAIKGVGKPAMLSVEAARARAASSRTCRISPNGSMPAWSIAAASRRWRRPARSRLSSPTAPRRSRRRRCSPLLRQRRKNSAPPTSPACSTTSPCSACACRMPRPGERPSGWTTNSPASASSSPATRWTTCSPARCARGSRWRPSARRSASRQADRCSMIGVVRARVEKPAKAGGKFAIVTLSDPSGEYELFVNDELLQNSRDILEVGERVICTVRVRRVDEELRFSMDGVKKLSQAAIGTHETLLVRAERRCPAGSHRQRGRRGSRKAPRRTRSGPIHIEIPVEGDRLVTIALDGRYPGRFRGHAGLQVGPGRQSGASGRRLSPDSMGISAGRAAACRVPNPRITRAIPTRGPIPVRAQARSVRGGQPDKETTVALPEFSMRQLLEAGAHFGHQIHRWNPKMKRFIFGERSNIHILDLSQTVPLLHQALLKVRETPPRAAACCSSAPSARRRKPSPRRRAAARSTT